MGREREAWCVCGRDETNKRRSQLSIPNFRPATHATPHPASPKGTTPHTQADTMAPRRTRPRASVAAVVALVVVLAANALATPTRAAGIASRRALLQTVRVRGGDRATTGPHPGRAPT